MRALTVLTFCFLSLFAEQQTDPRVEELRKIDAQIQTLEKARDEHAKRADYYQQEGDRWQYKTGNVQDAYAAWDKAKEERSQMIEAQTKIEELQQKKERLIRFYPELRSSDDS